MLQSLPVPIRGQAVNGSPTQVDESTCYQTGDSLPISTSYRTFGRTADASTDFNWTLSHLPGRASTFNLDLRSVSGRAGDELRTSIECRHTGPPGDSHPISIGFRIFSRALDELPTPTESFVSCRPEPNFRSISSITST